MTELCAFIDTHALDDVRYRGHAGDRGRAPAETVFQGKTEALGVPAATDYAAGTTTIYKVCA